MRIRRKKLEYAVYKIPKKLDDEVIKVVRKHGYRSKTEFNYEPGGREYLG